MDNRPIGVFDSGLGGLTTVKQLMAVLPRENLIYLGDTGRVPYGGRSRETLMKYTREDIGFLRRFDIKAIVAACGTVSTVTLDAVKGEYPLPITGVVDAAVRRAAAVTRNNRIGLIGTAASIQSGTYNRKLLALAPQAKVFGVACPLFVPLVENGRVHPGDVVIETVAREYLAPLQEAGIDTLILGCTHYPLLHDILAGILGPGVRLISPGAETANQVAAALREADLLADRPEPGEHRYFVTDSAEEFSRVASLFLGSDVNGEVQRVSLDAL